MRRGAEVAAAALAVLVVGVAAPSAVGRASAQAPAADAGAQIDQVAGELAGLDTQVTQLQAALAQADAVLATAQASVDDDPAGGHQPRAAPGPARRPGPGLRHPALHVRLGRLPRPPGLPLGPQQAGRRRRVGPGHARGLERGRPRPGPAGGQGPRRGRRPPGPGRERRRAADDRPRPTSPGAGHRDRAARGGGHPLRRRRARARAGHRQRHVHRGLRRVPQGRGHAGGRAAGLRAALGAAGRHRQDRVEPRRGPAGRVRQQPRAHHRHPDRRRHRRWRARRRPRP